MPSACSFMFVCDWLWSWSCLCLFVNLVGFIYGLWFGGVGWFGLVSLHAWCAPLWWVIATLLRETWLGLACVCVLGTLWCALRFGDRDDELVVTLVCLVPKTRHASLSSGWVGLLVSSCWFFRVVWCGVVWYARPSKTTAHINKKI